MGPIDYFAEYPFKAELPDGRWAGICPMSFGKGRLVVGDRYSPSFDDGWCYPSMEAAIVGLAHWVAGGAQGEPDGWHRHIGSGRRRPDLTAASEYVNP